MAPVARVAEADPAAEMPAPNWPTAPLFWQHLLAAGMPVSKSRDLLRDLGISTFSPVPALLADRRLTEREAAAARDADHARLDKVLSAGVTLWIDPEYRPLDACEQFPPALFCWGKADVLKEGASVAIVGTRRASNYGKAAAMKFAEVLAGRGVVIVSGGASGIDSAAHRGALAAPGGQTVAVLGTGIDVVFPSENRLLFEQIRESGCLMSHFAVGSQTYDTNFVLRNGTIAALVDAVIVVEAPEKSGALHTARAAAELGKPVYVVPGGIDDPRFRGSHALIRDGATLVDHPDQVLEDEYYQMTAASNSPAPAVDLTPAQDAILEILGTRPVSIEHIAQATDLDASELMAELTILELEGVIVRDGVGYALKP